MRISRKDHLRKVVQLLRAAKPPRLATATVEQMRRIVDDVSHGVSLPDIVQRTELHGLTGNDVRALIEAFGKYRSRVRKQHAVKASPVEAGSNAAGSLFGYSRTMLDSLGQAVVRGTPMQAEHLRHAPAHLFLQTRVIGLRTPNDGNGDSRVSDILGYDEVAGAKRVTIGQLRSGGYVPELFTGHGNTSLYMLWTRDEDQPLGLADTSGSQEVLDASPARLASKRPRKRVPRKPVIGKFVLPEWLRKDGVDRNACLKHAVVVPDGFEPNGDNPRDIGRSLAAAVVDGVEDSELIRFDLSRKPGRRSMAPDHVGLLHWFVRYGNVDSLLDVGEATNSDGANVVLCRNLAEAHEFLEEAFTDAESGLQTLLNSQDTDPETILDAALRCRWVSPDIDRIARVAGAKSANPTVDTNRLPELTQELAIRARMHPGSFEIGDIGQLDSGSVTQILRQHGRDPYLAEEKAARSRIRSTLVKMGAKNDLGRDIPAGMQAWHDGVLDEFYRSRQARLEGDPHWRDLLTGPPGESDSDTLDSSLVAESSELAM